MRCFSSTCVYIKDLSGYVSRRESFLSLPLSPFPTGDESSDVKIPIRDV